MPTQPSQDPLRRLLNYVKTTVVCTQFLLKITLIGLFTKLWIIFLIKKYLIFQIPPKSSSSGLSKIPSKPMGSSSGSRLTTSSSSSAIPVDKRLQMIKKKSSSSSGSKIESSRDRKSKWKETGFLHIRTTKTLGFSKKQIESFTIIC